MKYEEDEKQLRAWYGNSLQIARGMDIAKKGGMVKIDEGWLIPSQSGNGKYLVKVDDLDSPISCNCPNFLDTYRPCKHMEALRIFLNDYLKDAENKANESNEKKYSQNWAAYNRAQTDEGTRFMKLLSSLCSTINDEYRGMGRPTIPMSDMIFASALKVYSTFSLRRFMSDMKTAYGSGFVKNLCSYPSISNYMRKKELTPILINMIKFSSLPLKALEHDFAIDSTGFGTTRFGRYFSFKHEKDLKYHSWIKLHAVCGTKSNIVTSVAVSNERDNDSPYFRGLVSDTAKDFEIKEILADKAYSSRENMKLAGEIGAIPYIPFKINSKNRQGGVRIWKNMFLMFQTKNEEFMAHYHKRSNIETTFHMIKSKFGGSVRSKDKVAQMNEILLKILCHNICIVIQEMEELGLKFEFNNCEEYSKVSL